jgi:hypothetical protein
MNISDPVTGALLLLVMAGVWLWWAYAAGAILGLACLLRAQGAVRDAGLLALLANVAPFAVLVVLIPILFVLQIVVNGPLPDWLVIAPTVLGLAVGPIASLWLIGTIILYKARGTKLGAG